MKTQAITQRSILFARIRRSEQDRPLLTFVRDNLIPSYVKTHYGRQGVLEAWIGGWVRGNRTQWAEYEAVSEKTIQSWIADFLRWCEWYPQLQARKAGNLDAGESYCDMSHRRVAKDGKTPFPHLREVRAGTCPECARRAGCAHVETWAFLSWP